MAEAQQFYQAIGELQATLLVAADGARFLDTGDELYPVFVSEKVQKKYQDKYQGEQVIWRVYPRFKDQRFTFDVTTFIDQPQYGHGQFSLQGDWISAGRQLKIWRNADPGKINQYNWQPRLLPISWSDAPEPETEPEQTFWQFKAQLIDGTLKIVEAAGPFSHPPRLEALPQFFNQPGGEPKQPPAVSRTNAGLPFTTQTICDANKPLK